MYTNTLQNKTKLALQNIYAVVKAPRVSKCTPRMLLSQGNELKKNHRQNSLPSKAKENKFRIKIH
jgi:hypothetical protein